MTHDARVAVASPLSVTCRDRQAQQDTDLKVSVLPGLRVDKSVCCGAEIDRINLRSEGSFPA